MKKQHEEKENRERWLLTYADLITLLMIFFVVMYAISAVDVKKFQALAQALTFQFGGGRTIIGEFQGTSTIQLPAPSASSLETLREDTQELLDKRGLQRNSSASVQPRGLEITLANDLVFTPASAIISPRARRHLVALGKLLSETGGMVRVEGHTDNTPIHSAEFPSNWQLSAMRAANIAQVLVEQGGIDPRRITAVGLADSRPIASNGTQEGRLKNRRVMIVIPR